MYCCLPASPSFRNPIFVFEVLGSLETYNFGGANRFVQIDPAFHVFVTSRSQEACCTCSSAVHRHRFKPDVFGHVSTGVVRYFLQKVKGLALAVDHELSVFSCAFIRRTEVQIGWSHYF